MFQQIENYQAPRWPASGERQQFHLDVTVHEIEAAEQGVLALGATPLDGEGENWRVYADPAGKPFCLLWNAGEKTSRGGGGYRDGGLTRLWPHGHGSDDPALSAATPVPNSRRSARAWPESELSPGEVRQDVLRSGG